MTFLDQILAYFKKPFKNTRGRTVRYMFPVLIGFVSLLGAQLISSLESSYIRLEIAEQAVMKNETFAVDVYAYAHVPVNAVNITLHFDRNKVEVTQVDRGQSVLTIWTEDPVITDSTVTLRGGTFRRGFVGEHKIATIDVRAKKTGNSTFNTSDILFLAGDGKGTPVTTANTKAASAHLLIYDQNTNPKDISVDVAVRILTDLDGDGKVTLADISAFMSDWSNRSRLHDFNGDGQMTFRDFSIILADFFFK